MAGKSLMKKTFCDVDGKQCVNTTVLVHIQVHHHTKDGQPVGQDYFRPIEVCTDCETLLKRLFPQAFVMDHSRSEEPMIAETPVAYENAAARQRISREEFEEAMERRHNGE
jgi:hypothetical protein